jgi:hypothetical protein
MKMRGSYELPPVSKFSGNNYFSNSECPLPLFDENSVNPVLHLKQLDNYVKLKKIPTECRFNQYMYNPMIMIMNVD